MKLFFASEIAAITGEGVASVRDRLITRAKAGFLRGYVVVPLGETINSLDSMIAFALSEDEG